jgi:hypothetical protein
VTLAFGGRARRRRKAAERRLVKESESFLNGEFAESGVPADEPAPVWVWINLLAHGTAEQLRQEAVVRAGTDDWHRARSLLAARLLAAVASGDTSLTVIQRDVLVPLEFAIISSRTADCWSPAQLVTVVLDALADTDRRRTR